MYVSPSSLAAAISSGQPEIVLGPGTYSRPTIPAGARLTMYGDRTAPFGSIVFDGGIIIQGKSTQVILQNFLCRGGPITGVDGPSNVTCRSINVEDSPQGFNFTGGPSKSWGHDVLMDDCRARRCSIGRMIGESTRFRSIRWWADQCQNAANPSDSAYHPTYFSDQGTGNCEDHDSLETRNGGTGARGLPQRCTGYIGWQNNATVSTGRGLEQMDDCTLIDSGPLELMSYVGCSVKRPFIDNPRGPGIVINPACRSPWIQIEDFQIFSSEEAFRCMALHQDLETIVRHQQFDMLKSPSGSSTYQSSALFSQQCPDIPPSPGNPGLTFSQAYRFTDCVSAPVPRLRTPESYFTSVLGYPLDEVFSRAIPFSIDALRQYCRS